MYSPYGLLQLSNAGVGAALWIHCSLIWLKKRSTRWAGTGGGREVNVVEEDGLIHARTACVLCVP